MAILLASVGILSTIALQFFDKPDDSQVNDFKCRDFIPGLQDPHKPNNVTDSDLQAQYDVIVIGAGIAGLEAAHELDSEGMKVIVLETRDRIGGRINTLNYSGTSLDLGASWIHGYNPASNDIQNPIYKIAYYNNIEINRTDGSTEIRYPSGIVETSDQFYTFIDDFVADYENIVSVRPNHNYTLVEILANYTNSTNISNDDKALANFAISSEYEFDQAGDVADISGKSIDRTQYFNNWKDDEVIFPDGYNQIVNCLAGGLNIKHATVKNVDYTNSLVKVSTDKGIFVANYVISTIPLGVLKKNMTELFDPDFEQSKKNSINNLKMGTLSKTYIIFNDTAIPFWDELDNEWAIRVDDWKKDYVYDSEWRFFMDFHKFTGKPILLAFNAGSTAERLDNESNATNRQQIMSTLKTMYPNSTIPEPVEIIRTSWATDPLSFGTYSFIPVTGTMSDVDKLAESIDNKLFFAGEATSKRYYGTVHGAYISGYKAAQDILELKNNLDTIREQLDHGIHKDDICPINRKLDNELFKDPKCIPS